MHDVEATIRKRIRAIGNRIGPELFVGTSELFASLVPRPVPGAPEVERDVAYGTDPRHRLDLFPPRNPSGCSSPIVVFVHGGGFVGGDKGAADAPFYNNIGHWAAGLGLLGVTMTYRLAPQHVWPAGAEDIATALSWLKDNASTWGGDPHKIFLFGQSAGAAHVASYVAKTELHGQAPPLAGAIMLSGIYDILNFDHGPYEEAYYGADVSKFAEQSSINGLVASEIPCMFAVAEFDPPNFQRQAALLVERWLAARQTLPRLLYLPDGNHMSGALGIGRDGDFLSAEISAFVDKCGNTL